MNQVEAREEPSVPVDAVKSKRLLFTLKVIIGFIFMVVVLGSSVLSKLTLLSLTDKLRSVSYSNTTQKIKPEDRDMAVTLYWYLQFILLIPNCITFVRCLAFGVIGKTTNSFPWPKGWSIIIVRKCSCSVTTLEQEFVENRPFLKSCRTLLRGVVGCLLKKTLSLSLSLSLSLCTHLHPHRASLVLLWRYLP